MTNKAQTTIDAVLFDMDGLLLDTEPLWVKSMLQIAKKIGLNIGTEELKYTRGYPITEVIQYWKENFTPNTIEDIAQIADDILDLVIEEAIENGKLLPGVLNTLNFCKEKKLKIGLATSSPIRMMNKLIHFFQLNNFFDIMVSAETVRYGKPHPEVFLKCAEKLAVAPQNCLVFEDSIHGMISGKAAKMTVIVVPEKAQYNHPGFGTADIKLKSLEEFNENVWQKVNTTK